MSTTEENVIDLRAAVIREKTGLSVPSRALRLLSSVRLGVVLLCLLALACLIGMLIMQQSVEGFENYYATLTPAQRLVYGKLDFFDIYHAWYFNALLCVLSLNIVLASLDRFPKTWLYVAKRQVVVPLRWLTEQKQALIFDATGSTDEFVRRATKLLKNYSFLHSRIAYRWKGSRSAYFAVVAFLFVIFTYLGVSYLLPGLHSYA